MFSGLVQLCCVECQFVVRFSQDHVLSMFSAFTFRHKFTSIDSSKLNTMKIDFVVTNIFYDDYIRDPTDS